MTSTLMVATILHARILSSRKKIENLEKKFFFLPELDGRLAGLGPPAGQQLHKPDFFTYSISSYFTFVNLILFMISIVNLTLFMHSLAIADLVSKVNAFILVVTATHPMNLEIGNCLQKCNVFPFLGLSYWVTPKRKSQRAIIKGSRYIGVAQDQTIQAD